MARSLKMTPNCLRVTTSKTFKFKCKKVNVLEMERMVVTRAGESGGKER
jgi:hypothetical protein